MNYLNPSSCTNLWFSNSFLVWYFPVHRSKMEFVTIRRRRFGLARMKALKHSLPFLQSNIGIPRILKKMELGLDVSSRGIIPQEQWKNVKKTKTISYFVIFLDFVYLLTELPDTSLMLAPLYYAKAPSFPCWTHRGFVTKVRENAELKQISQFLNK